MRYFNSIKVQLEQPKTDARTSVFIFQFHKGTIRTPDTLPFRLLPLIFQFHKGTIRTYKTKEVEKPASIISIP